MQFDTVKTKIKKVYDRFKKPIVFTEIGFRSVDTPWKNPHAEADDTINEEAQRKHENAQVSATTAQVGEKIVWHDNDSSGYVMTTKEGTSTDGLSCREFQQEITIGDETEQAYGTACLQADGAWKIVSDNEA